MSSLYLHIPFCERKCVYCDFYSIERLDPLGAFLDALDREITMYAEYGGGQHFDTVYFGGGTPSLLTPPQLERIVRRLRDTFAIDSGSEVTLETNPGTVTQEKLEAYRSLGVNRLSIGIQSFREEELRFLGRIHTAAEAESCVRMARMAGYDNVSVDLIYSLPSQTLLQWEETLHRTLGLAPDHISAYSLIVEAGTPLARMVAARQVSPNPVEMEALLFEHTMDVLDAAGFEHYEVSNYARPGRRSRHNYAYWSHRNYLAFGPSAHAFWRVEGWRRARRWANAANLSTYIDKISHGEAPVTFREEVNERELMNERVFLGLRSDGIDLHRFAEDFGRELPPASLSLARALEGEGKAVLDAGRVRLTAQGFLLCDEIAGRMIV
ncbi:MAG: radical SAM family heme chaperone HemW [Bacteroidota bacterium]